MDPEKNIAKPIVVSVTLMLLIRLHLKLLKTSLYETVSYWQL